VEERAARRVDAESGDERLAEIRSALTERLTGELREVEERLEETQRLRDVARLLGEEGYLRELESRIDGGRARLQELGAALETLGPQRAVPAAGIEGGAQRKEPPTGVATTPVGPATNEIRLFPNAPGATEAAPQPAPAGPPTAARSRAAQPAWEPRPLDQVESDLQTVRQGLSRLEGDSPRELALFKMYGCLLWGGWEERKRYPGLQDEWRAVNNALKDRQKETWPRRYCIPLSPDARLTPPEWRRLAELYCALAEAEPALAWVEETALSQPDLWISRECAPLLEACGAVSSQMHRWLHQHLPSQRDDQQLDLYERLRDVAGQRVFIRSLQPEDVVGDAELHSLAAELEARFRTLRVATERKVRQAESVAGLAELLARPGFGGRDGDDDLLCEAAAACLDAGVPATDKRLRDPLLDWAWMLDDDPRLTRLQQAVVAEQARQEARGSSTGQAEAENPFDLPGELQAMLNELLPRTSGCKGVVIGGVCRETNRQAIETTLRLSELKWPSTDPSDAFERSAKEIARADFVLLTRFNRKSSKEAITLCRQQGKTLVRLPKGYGLHEVIYRTHEQVFQRS
jgi:hypothetical protein